MTINPLEHIPRKPFTFNPDDPYSYQLYKITKEIIENKKSKKTYNVKIIGNIYDSQQSKK